jgi:hypothetical protein
MGAMPDEWTVEIAALTVTEFVDDETLVSDGGTNPPPEGPHPPRGPGPPGPARLPTRSHHLKEFNYEKVRSNQYLSSTTGRSGHCECY